MIAELLSTKGFVTLVFGGLAGHSDHAATQKALIAQAIRAAFPNPSAFIEEDTRFDYSVESDSTHQILKLRCVACPPPDASDFVATDSVSFMTQPDNPKDFRLQFETKPNGTLWKIQGISERLMFSIATTRRINSGESITASDLVVVPCTSIRSCRQGGTFERFQDARSLVELQTSGLVAKRTLPAGAHFEEKDATQPEAVKRGSEVSIIIKKDSGLSVRSRGTALVGGAIGERIKVRISGPGASKNRSQSQGMPPIMAQISAPGEVKYEQ